MNNYNKVFALGGSIFTENLERIDEYAEALENHSPTAAVIGAGHLKKNIEAVNGSQSQKDLIGIHATRFNAKTLAVEMDAHPEIPEDIGDVQRIARNEDNIALGGFSPGFSTDAVAAIVAEALGAKLYIATDVDSIYTEDPSNASAEKIEEASIEDIRSIIGGNSSKAGSYKLIDRTAVDIIERSEIPGKVLKGTPENLESPEEAEGTEITNEN